MRRLVVAMMFVTVSVCAYAQNGQATTDDLLARLKAKDQDIVSCAATVGGLQDTINQQGKQIGAMNRHIKELEASLAAKK